MIPSLLNARVRAPDNGLTVAGTIRDIIRMPVTWRALVETDDGRFFNCEVVDLTLVEPLPVEPSADPRYQWLGRTVRHIGGSVGIVDEESFTYNDRHVSHFLTVIVPTVGRFTAFASEFTPMVDGGEVPRV
jgi:hypothetical protein